MFDHGKKQNIGYAFVTGFTILSTVFPFSVFGDSRAEYRVIHGDTLSDIVWAFLPGKIYGKTGNLLSVEKLNPQLGERLRKSDYLLPGDIVQLPGTFRYSAEQTTDNKNIHRNRNFLNRREVQSRLTYFAEPELPKDLPQNKNAVIRAPASQNVREEPTAVPLAEPKNPEQKKEHFLRSASLELSPFYRLDSLSLRDSSSNSQAQLVTNIYTGMEVAYVQKWRKDFESFATLHLGIISFEPPKALNKSLESTNHFQSGIGFGVRKRFYDSFWIQAHASYQKQLFGRAISSSIVAVDTVAIPSVELKTSYDVVNAEPFVFGLSGLYGVHFGTQANSYAIRQGSSIGGNLYIKQFLSGGNKTVEPNFQTEVGFYRRSQNSGNIEQSESTFFLNLRFLLPFGRNEEERMK